MILVPENFMLFLVFKFKIGDRGHLNSLVHLTQIKTEVLAVFREYCFHGLRIVKMGICLFCVAVTEYLRLFNL